MRARNQVEMLVGHLQPAQWSIFRLNKVFITSRVTYDELRPYVPLFSSILECYHESLAEGVRLLTRIEMIDGKPANPSCEALVQPELIPPVHGHKVAKPLMCEF